MPSNSPPGLLSLLSHGMGQDLHWFPEDVSVSRLAAAMVGMANTIGGTILLGVAPRSGEVLGVREPPAAIDRVFQSALLSDPPLVLPIPTIQTIGNSRLVCVVIPRGLPHVYSLDGRFLGREGHQTNPLAARRLRELLLERGEVQFETRIPPEATLDDLDPDKIAEYLTAIGYAGSDSPEEILFRRGCLKKNSGQRSAVSGQLSEVGGGYLPTYAAILLFGKHPQQWLPSATLLAARFPGVSFSDRYIKQEIRGTLPDQLRQAEAFLRDNLRSIVRLVGLMHQETPEYPFEAVRELLVNAVAHRDYNLQGDNIHLHLSADRLEVHSPGELPGPVTLDNLLQARFSRNAVIVQALADLGFVERLGYGLDRVVTAMKQADLRPPQFEETAGTFRVTLFGLSTEADQRVTLPNLEIYRAMNLSLRQQAALAFLLSHGRITSSDYQSLCPDVHAETLRRDLADMVSRGALIKVGDKKATYYILK